MKKYHKTQLQKNPQFLLLLAYLLFLTLLPMNVLVGSSAIILSNSFYIFLSCLYTKPNKISTTTSPTKQVVLPFN